MKNNKGLFIGIAVIAVIIIAGIAAMAAGGNNKGSYSGQAAKSQPANSSPSPNNSASNASSAVAADTVTISNYMFKAPAITVKVGTKVTWTNKDGVKHNVVADKPTAEAPNGPLIGNDETYSFTFTKPGTYTYHCVPHPYMKGSVVVTQ